MSQSDSTRRSQAMLVMFVLVIAAVAGGTLALALGTVLDPAPAVLPYDPLPRW
jgi:hypothetical protein